MKQLQFKAVTSKRYHPGSFYFIPLPPPAYTAVTLVLDCHRHAYAGRVALTASCLLLVYSTSSLVNEYSRETGSTFNNKLLHAIKHIHVHIEPHAAGHQIHCCYTN